MLKILVLIVILNVVGLPGVNANDYGTDRRSGVLPMDRLGQSIDCQILRYFTMADNLWTAEGLSNSLFHRRYNEPSRDQVRP